MPHRFDSLGRIIMLRTQPKLPKPAIGDIYPAAQLRDPTISEMQEGARNLKLVILTEACRPEYERWCLRNPEMAHRIEL